MNDVLSLFRIWFLLGMPLALLSDQLGLQQTALGSVWVLAVGVPLLGMACLQPQWLLQWLLQPVAGLWRLLVRAGGHATESGVS